MNIFKIKYNTQLTNGQLISEQFEICKEDDSEKYLTLDKDEFLDLKKLLSEYEIKD